MKFFCISMLNAGVDFNPIIAPVLDVLNAILWPAIALVGSIGTIYCIILGAKLAKTDEGGSREKAKKDLVGAIIGFVSIFVLILTLKLALPILQDWVSAQLAFSMQPTNVVQMPNSYHCPIYNLPLVA